MTALSSPPNFCLVYSVLEMTLSMLLARHLEAEAGNTHGRCYLCGIQTQHGHRRKPSEKFTSWTLCTEGQCLCPLCDALLKDQRLRNRSWAATPTELIFPTRPEFLSLLLEPPAPPFAMYFTLSGKRQDYLALMHAVSHSRECYFVGTDFTPHPILTQRPQIPPMLALLRPLLQVGIPRSVLTGEQALTPTHARKLHANHLWHIWQQAEPLRLNPLFQLLARVAQ